MKAVMLSIQPKWCDLIASGKKTIEVRKTAPKLHTPFKCYIYCTLSGCKQFAQDDLLRWGKGKWYEKKGKVLGEFVCDEIEDICFMHGQIEGSCEPWYRNVQGTALAGSDLMRYGNGKMFYGWHISDLKIYDTPKELREFFSKGECRRESCAGCRNFHRGEGWLDGSYCDEDSCIEWGIKPLTRPPQSWCYVEEL